MGLSPKICLLMLFFPWILAHTSIKKNMNTSLLFFFVLPILLSAFPPQFFFGRRNWMRGGGEIICFLWYKRLEWKWFQNMRPAQYYFSHIFTGLHFFHHLFSISFQPNNFIYTLFLIYSLSSILFSFTLFLFSQDH